MNTNFGTLNGGGGFQNSNGGFAGNYQHPNGTQAGVSYGHQNGWGHDVSVHGTVPVYTSPNGATTVTGSAGVSQHFGGPMGNKKTGHSFGLGIQHRF